MDGQSIQITKIANGYLVVIPVRYEYGEVPIIGGVNYKQLAKSMKEGMQEAEMDQFEKLQNENKGPACVPDLPTMGNHYTFKSMLEVLAFLQKTFE